MKIICHGDSLTLNRKQSISEKKYAAKKHNLKDHSGGSGVIVGGWVPAGQS